MNPKIIKQILILNNIITILFIIYIEYIIGNIFYRIDSSGFKHFNIINLIYYLISPLNNIFLWHIDLLDVNYIFIILFTNIIYYLFNI